MKDQLTYCIFGFEGTGFSIAERLMEEGKHVLIGQVNDKKTILVKTEQVCVEDSSDKELRMRRYNYILEKIDAQKLVDRLKKIKDPQNYFLFFESNNLFYYSEQLKNFGFKGNFPEEEDRLFEVDRNFAKNFVKRYYPKIKVAPKIKFRLINKAIEFLKKSKDAWVVKSQNDAVQTFVPESDEPNITNSQIIEHLENYRQYYEESGIFLELKIPNALEMDVEKIYYDGVPISLCLDIENKFVGCGNLSFQVGCAGDLNFSIPIDNPIHDICFPSIVDKLAKKRKGLFFWDASILIDQKTGEIYFSEFCPNRPRYNTIFTYLTQMPSVHYFFNSIVQKKNPFTFGSIGASVMLFNLLHDINGQILADASITISRNAKKNIWGYDFYKKSSSDRIRTSGYDIHLAPVTGTGKTITQAVDNLYDNVNGFSMGQVYYRPKFDFLSTDYPTSIMNRLEYALSKKLFTLPFRY